MQNTPKPWTRVSNFSIYIQKPYAWKINGFQKLDAHSDFRVLHFFYSPPASGGPQIFVYIYICINIRVYMYTYMYIFISFICMYPYLYSPNNFVLGHSPVSLWSIRIWHGHQTSNIKVFRPCTHLSRHAHTFPRGYRTLQDFYIVCGGLELKKSNLKNEHAPIRNFFFRFPEIYFQSPYVNKQGLSNARFRIEIASESCIRQPFVFYFRSYIL